jgi:hypothetical protein
LGLCHASDLTTASNEKDSVADRKECAFHYYLIQGLPGFSISSDR